MARSFNGSSEYLEADTAALTTVPITMACWFYTASNTVDETLMWLGDKNAADQYWELFAAGSVAGDPIRARTSAGAASAASTSTTFAINTWQHACAVFAAANARSVFLDGGGKGTNATSRAPTTPNRTSVGRRGVLTPVQYWNGRVAEAAIWNVALADNEVWMLAQGLSPTRVRPANLTTYWLIGRDSPEPDYGGAVLNLTVTGTSIADHAPVAPPFALWSGWFGQQVPTAAVETYPAGHEKAALNTLLRM